MEITCAASESFFALHQMTFVLVSAETGSSTHWFRILSKMVPTPHDSLWSTTHLVPFQTVFIPQKEVPSLKMKVSTQGSPSWMPSLGVTYTVYVMMPVSTGFKWMNDVSRCWFLFFSLFFACKKEKKKERKRRAEKIFSWKRSKKSVHKGGLSCANMSKYERIDEFKLSSFF